MNDIVRRMRLGLTMRFWLLGVISAAILTSAVACSDDPEPTSISVPEPTATSVPTQAAATDAPPAATTVPPTATAAPPTATPEPEVEVIDAEPLNVVATSNIVGEWVSIVGGDRVDVLNLVPRGVDPHGYQPGARDIARVADAEIVFAVGLSLEQQWLEDLIDNAAADHEVVIELGQRIDPIEFSFEAADAHAEDGEAMAAGGDEGATLSGRLLVGDADSDHLMIIDLMTEDVSELDIGLPGPVSAIYASPNHRFGYAIYRGDEGDHVVHTIDGGVFLVQHGDHEDLVVVPVSEVGLTVNDDRPIHFTNGGEWSAIFHDGSGQAALMNEHEIEEEGHAYEVPYLDAGPQHGAAVPIENDLFAVTVANPDPEDSLPIGVEIRNLDDEVVWDGSRDACPGMHGEAHNHDGSAYGCNGGVLFVEQHGDEFDHWFIENGEGMPEAGRVGTLWGHEDSAHFFGKAVTVGPGGFGDAGIWMIDPEEQEMVQVLAPSETKESVTSAFSHDGHALYVLTYDGMLNVIDAADGDVIGEAQLVDPIDSEAEFDAAPSLIVVGETLFLSDPATQHVIAFDLDHLEVVEEWEVHGTPSSLAYVGIVSSEGHPAQGHGHDAEVDDHDDEEAEALEDEQHHDDEDEDAEATEDDAHHGDEDQDAEGDEGEGHGDEDEDDNHAEDEVEHHHEDDGHGHGALDPHFWFDPDRVIIAVRQIAKELRELDPGSADYYNANRDEYIAKLEELDGWITDSVSAIDDHDRIMVTTHDAFGYFAARFGFEIAGVIIPGGGTELERSPQELAELVHEVEEAGASVVFAEAQLSDRLANTLAREAGIRFIGGLHVGSLGADGSGAEGYLDLMRSNVGIIVEALAE